jgi:sugar-specific transcriptional regulator TrmB
MNATPFEDALESLGATRQEALLYRALLEHGGLNGYEAAKETGISRSNAYHALASLVDKGFADRIEGESTRYAAVAPTDLALLLRRRHEAALDALIRAAPAPRAATTPFLDVSGRDRVLEKVRLLLDSTEDRVYLSAPADDLDAIRPDLTRALERGVRLTILTTRTWTLERAVVLVRRSPRGLRLIVDGRRVLTGELDATSAACVLSENAHLVSLIKDTLTHEIELARLREAGKDTP